MAEQVNAWNKDARFCDPVTMLKRIILDLFKLLYLDGIEAAACNDTLTPACYVVYWNRFQTLISNPRTVEVTSGSILVKKNTDDAITARRNKVNIESRSCDCGLWIQDQQPCLCALAACNHLQITDIFNDTYFGSELLTKTWKSLHAHPTLQTQFPGDNDIFTTAAASSIAIESHDRDAAVTHSQKRIMSSGDDRRVGSSCIALSKLKKGALMLIYYYYITELY